MPRVLLVEDDELLGDGIDVGLKHYGYTVDWVKDGQWAQQILLSMQNDDAEHFDVVVLDLGLPRRNGLDVLRTIRTRQVDIPVIILTARDNIDDRVAGLDAGADDYLIKPFDLDELCARIRALCRRSVSRADPMIVAGQIKLDPAGRQVYADDQPINLSRREFTLLHKLIEKPGLVITRDNLAQTLYGWGEDVDSNAIEVHIHNLRKKLGDHLNIRTVRGVGYVVDKPNKATP